ncbi:hypothetical protein [Nonomuraea bangladeshensis]|uniref:hypothetical protein n=1 Tax=Nonomuraea bangladeshensis TaxID=404385 RepID=UPI003C2BD4F4
MNETATQTLRHEVRALHGTTGGPLPVRAAFVPRPPHGWSLRAGPGLVVVVETAHGPATTPPSRLRLEVSDPRLAVRLAAPATEVDLDQPVVTHFFAPAPSTLEVGLLTATGDPSTGRTVVAHPSVGQDVPLTEEVPGVYRSAPVAWTAEFHPFEIRVGSLLLRRAFIDVTRPATRIRLIDTT